MLRPLLCLVACFSLLFVSLTPVCGQDADHLYNEGRIQFEQGDILAASKSFQASVVQRPDFMDAHFLLGLCYAMLERQDAAIRQFTRVIQAMPLLPRTKQADALFQRGRCFARQRHIDKAIADFDAALEISPTPHEVLWHRAQAQFADRRYDAAITDFEKYLRIAPQPDPTTHQALSEAYTARFRQRNQMADARAAFASLDRAIQAQPDNATLYYAQVDLYCDLKQWGAASVSLAQARKATSPIDLYPVLLQARISAGKGEWSRAETGLNQAAMSEIPLLQQRTALEYMRLGDDYYKSGPNGDRQKAITLYDKALSVYDRYLAPAQLPVEERADAYYQRAVTLDSRFKADSKMTTLLATIQAYKKYVNFVETLMPSSRSGNSPERLVAAKQRLQELN